MIGLDLVVPNKIGKIMGVNVVGLGKAAPKSPTMHMIGAFASRQQVLYVRRQCCCPYQIMVGQSDKVRQYGAYIPLALARLRLSMILISNSPL